MCSVAIQTQESKDDIGISVSEEDLSEGATYKKKNAKHSNELISHKLYFPQKRNKLLIYSYHPTNKKGNKEGWRPRLKRTRKRRKKMQDKPRSVPSLPASHITDLIPEDKN